MKDTTITITISPLGYAYLLELLEMAEITADYYDDDDNRAAVDAIKQEIIYWGGDNIEQAKEAGDTDGLRRLEEILAEAGLDADADAADEEPEETNDDADDDSDDDAPENKTDAYDAVWHYLGRPEGEFLRRILEEAAADAKQDHTNLFKAGQFEGTARMLAAAIVNDGADGGEGVAAITRAAYDFCGVAW